MPMVLVKKKIPSLSHAKTIWIDVYSFFVVSVPTTIPAPTKTHEGKNW